MSYERGAAASFTPSGAAAGIVISLSGIPPEPSHTCLDPSDSTITNGFSALAFSPEYSSIFPKKLFSGARNSGSPSLLINSPANVFIRYFSGRQLHKSQSGFSRRLIIDPQGD